MKIVKKKISDTVIEAITEQIKNGDLKEGDRLPNLTDYAKQLGVSRLSVREAVRTLEQLGAVRSIPKVGTTIVCDDISKWAYPTVTNIFDDVDTLQQLFDARILFEGFFASSCAKNLTSDAAASLTDIISRQRKAIAAGNINQFYELDTLFHTSIASYSNNIFIQRGYVELIESTNNSVTEILRRNPQNIQGSLEMHEKILKAILEKDPEQAEYYARRHLQALKESKWREEITM